jgi:hypothetical protein
MAEGKRKTIKTLLDKECYGYPQDTSSSFAWLKEKPHLVAPQNFDRQGLVKLRDGLAAVSAGISKDNERMLAVAHSRITCPRSPWKLSAFNTQILLKQKHRVMDTVEQHNRTIPFTSCAAMYCLL